MIHVTVLHLVMWGRLCVRGREEGGEEMGRGRECGRGKRRGKGLFGEGEDGQELVRETGSGRECGRKRWEEELECV